MRKLNACRGVWFVEPFVVGTIFAYQGEIHEEHGALINMVAEGIVVNFIEGSFAVRMGIAEREVVAVGNHHIVFGVNEHDAVLRFPVVDNTVFVQGVVEIFVGITLFFWYSDVFF